MQRVHRAVVLDGAGRGHQRLAGHLAPEDALAALVGRHAPEDVDLDDLEVEEVDEVVDVGLHRPILPHVRFLAAAFNTDGPLADRRGYAASLEAHVLAARHRSP